MKDYDFYNKKYSEKEIRECIKEYPEQLDWAFWYYLSKHQDLSEPFIREFQDKVLWHLISKYQTLSEDFIRDFQDYVDWYFISKYQNLSEKFLIEFIEKINSYCLKNNVKIPKDVKQRIINLKRLMEV